MSSQAPDWLILPGASRAVLIDPSDWSTKGERGGNAAERGESRKGGGGDLRARNRAGAAKSRENSGTCSNVRRSRIG
jgi:hypothetical protein